MAANPFGKLGEIGEEIEQGAVQHGKAAVQTAVTQVTGKSPSQKQPAGAQTQNPHLPSMPDSGTNEAAQAAAQVADQQATKNFVNELYAPSDKSDKKIPAEMQTLAAAGNSQKTPEELQKIEALKSRLHQEMYYEPTFNRPQQQEERQGEVREKEEEERVKQLEELKEKQKKEAPPMAVQQAALGRERKFGAG